VRLVSIAPDRLWKLSRYVIGGSKSRVLRFVIVEIDSLDTVVHESIWGTQPQIDRLLRILTKSNALSETSEHSPGQTMETLQTIGMGTPADPHSSGPYIVCKVPRYVIGGSKSRVLRFVIVEIDRTSEHSPGQTMETLQTIGMGTPADSSERGFPIWTHELQYLVSLRAFDFVSIRKSRSIWGSFVFSFLLFTFNGWGLTKSNALSETSEHSPGQTMETLQTIGMGTPADSSERGFPIWTHELQYLSCQSRQ
jgi:hypothetical protein